MREYKAPFESLDGGRIKTLSLATYRQVCNVAGSAVFLRPLSMKHDINAHFLQMPIPVYVSSMPLLIKCISVVFISYVRPYPSCLLCGI